jgi:hypothetical protein
MSDDSDYSADFTGSDNDSGEEEEKELPTLKDALLQFYKKHAPSDVKKVDSIMAKYAGREAVIFKALRKKCVGSAGVWS